MTKKKSELYNEERQLILNKILEILNINENNKTFFLYELDSNQEKQNKILELEENIRKCFVCGSWACFANDNIKRKVLSLIKNVMREMKYIMISKRKLIKSGDIKHQETYYILLFSENSIV
jgi:hypothetical protein